MLNLHLLFILPLLLVLLTILIAAVVQAHRASCAHPEWKGRIWTFGLLGSVSFVVFFGIIVLPAFFPQMLLWNRGPVICGSGLLAVVFCPLYSYYVVEALYDFHRWW